MKDHGIARRKNPKNLVEELIVTNSNFRDVFVDSDPDLENEEEEE